MRSNPLSGTLAVLVVLIPLGIAAINSGGVPAASFSAAALNSSVAPVGFTIPGTVNPIIGQQAVASNKSFSFVMTWGNEKDGAGVEVRIGNQSFAGAIPTGGTVKMGNATVGTYSISATVVNTAGGIFNVSEITAPATPTPTPPSPSPVSPPPVSTTALFSKFKTVTDSYSVASDDVGSMVTVSPSSSNASITLPPPSFLSVGTFGVRKGNNNSNYVQIRRADGQAIAGWNFVNLDMHGDWVHIGNTGSDYTIVASGQVPTYGPRGQHRTPTYSAYPNGYYPHAGDRGSLIRAVSDTGNLVVYLPKAADMGFSAGGYRNGFQLGVMAVSLPSGRTVKVHANGSSINRQPYIVLDKDTELVWLDFDSNEWFITSHYEPSGVANQP